MWTTAKPIKTGLVMMIKAGFLAYITEITHESMLTSTNPFQAETLYQHLHIHIIYSLYKWPAFFQCYHNLLMSLDWRYMGRFHSARSEHCMSDVATSYWGYWQNQIGWFFFAPLPVCTLSWPGHKIDRQIVFLIGWILGATLFPITDPRVIIETRDFSSGHRLYLILPTDNLLMYHLRCQKSDVLALLNTNTQNSIHDLCLKRHRGVRVSETPLKHFKV